MYSLSLIRVQIRVQIHIHIQIVHPNPDPAPAYVKSMIQHLLGKLVTAILDFLIMSVVSRGNDVRLRGYLGLSLVCENYILVQGDGIFDLPQNHW
jgi:hypothetical protein